MTFSSLPDWLQFLICFTLASLIGSASYLLFWAIQRKLGSTKPLIALGTLALIVSLIWETSRTHILVGPAFLSSFFRWCADESASELSKCFWCVFVSTAASVWGTELLFGAFPTILGYGSFSEGPAPLVALLAPSLTPLLMRAWQDLTLRPGVDQLFEE